jgi:hypothetical protein
MVFFTTNDPLHRNVYLPNNSWKHIQDRHPEFSTWGCLKGVIGQPDIITDSVRKTDRDIYYKIGALDTYPSLYVAVVVGFNKNDGVIITAHLSEYIQVGPGGYKYGSK